MAIPSSEPVTHVPFAELKALLESIFERHG